MPTNKSTKKRLRQNAKKREINKGVKSEIKTLKKKVLSATASGGGEGLEKAMKECFSALDKAAGKNILHKRKVARDKSRLIDLADQACYEAKQRGGNRVLFTFKPKEDK